MPAPYVSPSDSHLHAPYVQFSAFAHELSIEVTARQGCKLAPVFGKKFKKFPGSSIRAGARHRHPDDRAAISHPLYSVFFGKRSEKNGLFSKKVRILPLWRPVHTQKIAKRSPPKKSSKPYIQKILAIDQRKKDFFQKKFRFCLSDVPAVCKNHETFHRFR